LDGWLVFESRRHDTNNDGAIDLQDGIHIYTLNLATNEVNQLTTGDHFDLKPAWSPDGSQIAFMSNRDGNYELFTINADGTNLRQLTNTTENEGTPTWAPDGTQIAYVVASRLDSGLEKREIYLLSAHDQQTHPLAANDLTNTFEPVWSPDGKFLVFTGEAEVTENGVTSYDNAIYLLDTSSNAIHRLTSPGVQVSSPKWLPRNGYFLSILQSPGVFSSGSINVFELQQNAERFLLRQVFIIEDVFYNYVWGTNGEWFISMANNNLQDATVEAEFNSLDLAVAPVDFATQQYSGTSLGGSYNYSFIEASRLLSDNTFYDGFPDWTP
jgi:Tol biopolymer transport system component